MLPKQEVVAMLLAGGRGSRLGVLTKNLAKPAVPFGGKYRIIDFPLSNCVNSGIETVGVLTQYQPLELNEYIGSGQPWDLDSMNAGVHILQPYEQSSGSDWYKGTANAIYQNIPCLLYTSELTVNTDNPFARTGKSGSKTSTYYGSNNKAYFAVTLTGQFNYTYGSSAKATGASTSVTVYDSSASYVTKSATYSGATATGTGTVKVNATSRTLTVKITCDKYGNLS